MSKKIIVSKDTIAKLNPCSDRFNNYVKYYGDKEFTVKQFLALKKITYKDKLWVAFRAMSLKNARIAAIDIAKSVLHIYEKRYPGDMRPRTALENPTKKTAAYAAAYADAAAAAYAYAAAYAAADAAVAADAAYAAYAAADAAVAAAAYAADAAYAAYAAADAAVAAAAYAAAAYAGRTKQETLNLKIIAKHWK